MDEIAMADEQQTAGKEDDVATKGNSKLMIIIIIMVVLLIIAGGAAYWLLGPGSSDQSAMLQSTDEETLPRPASYVNIARPFLFSIPGQQRDRLVQIKVQIMVRGAKNEKLARHHSPLIESTILNTFGSVTVEQLQTLNGRTQLREQTTENVRQAMDGLTGQPVIENVLFTDFVIQ